MFIKEIKEKLLFFGERVIKFGAEEYTYKEMLTEIENTAAYFANNGLKDRKIFLLGQNSYRWIVLHFAILFSGNKAILADPSSSVEHLQEIFSHANGDLIIMETPIAEMMPAYTYENIAERVPLMPDLQRHQQEDKGIVYIATSGTTGTSKIVELSEENLFVNLSEIGGLVQLTGAALIVLPLSHMFGLMGTVYLAIFEGQDIIIAEKLTDITRLLKREKIELLFCVPAIAKMIVRFLQEKTKAELVGEQFSTMYVAGAQVTNELRTSAAQFDIRVLSGYGCTEASPVVSLEKRNDTRDGTVGQILPSVDLKFIDVVDGIGEIVIRGKSVITSYYYSEEHVSQSFIDGWFKTGDLGFLADGLLTLTGRRKNLIILDNGKNISPEKLEAFFLQKLSSIEDLVVFGDNDKLVLEIFIGEIDSVSIRDMIMKQVMDANNELPSYERINEIIYRDQAFAKTRTHKIMRNKINEQKVGEL